MPCGICWRRLVILGLRSTSRPNCPHPSAHPSPSAAIRAINGRRELARFGKARHFVLFLNDGLLWREKFIHLRFKSHQNMAFTQYFQCNSSKSNRKKKSIFFWELWTKSYSAFLYEIHSILFRRRFSIRFQLLSPGFSPPPIEPLTDVGRCPSHMPPGTNGSTRLIWFEKKTDQKRRWQNQKKKSWHNFIWNVYLADLWKSFKTWIILYI